jgi:histidinol dehydrogenase
MPPASAIPLIRYPGKAYDTLRADLRQTRQARGAGVELSVRTIIDAIRKKGDRALFAYAKKFDGIALSAGKLRIDPRYIARRASLVRPDLARAILEAAARIKRYHQRQKPVQFSLRTTEGKLSQVIRPLRRVGVYVPGGYTCYPSSVLMTVLPARIAGVAEIAAAMPFKNELDPAVAFAFNLLKIDEVYRMGGAQAIAALALGTQSVKKVDKIVGPGNAYVACAKKMVFGEVAIDSVAGPSEVVILADETADPGWAALDMLAQAEHGTGDESAWLITENEQFARAVAGRLREEIARSPVREIFAKLSPTALAIFVTKSRTESLRLVNECAPEHVEIITRTAHRDLDRISTAGAAFVGPWSPVALGDYFVGTNHVLPTGQAARYASPLGVEDFLRRMSVAEISASGCRRSAPYVSLLARAERFVHHALSVERRAGNPAME